MTKRREPSKRRPRILNRPKIRQEHALVTKDLKKLTKERDANQAAHDKLEATLEKQNAKIAQLTEKQRQLVILYDMRIE